MADPVEFVRQARRVRTEESILDAFETVLLREGASGVTAQGVADAAGVAKTLIYKYYGGLEGLIETWGRQRDIFVPLDELFPDRDAAAESLQRDPYAFAKMQIMKQAEHMRTHPVYIELCIAELSGSGPVIDALMKLRRERNEAESKALGKTLDGSSLPTLLPIMLLPAAITYLAMRARKSPLFAGVVRLDTDAGWASMMLAVEQVIDLLALAAKMAELTKGDQQLLMDTFQAGLDQQATDQS
jgi:AcrR family transcriptional regulator